MLDRGPVRHRRRRRPRRGDRRRRADHAAHDGAARPGRHGLARPQRRDPPGRQPLQAVVGRRARRRRRLRRRPRPRPAHVVHDVADERRASRATSRATCSTRPSCSASSRRRRGRDAAAARQDQARAPSSGCSGRCARRSSSPSTTPASRSCRRRRAPSRDGAAGADRPADGPLRIVRAEARRAMMTPCAADRRSRGDRVCSAFFTRPDAGSLWWSVAAAARHAGPAAVRRRSRPGRRASSRRRPRPSSAPSRRPSPAC